MRKNLDRALAAKRESRRVALRETFNAGSIQDWCEIVRDIVAMANSGGGVILFGVDHSGQLDPAAITDSIHRYTDSNFSNFEIVDAVKDSTPVVALVIGEAPTPIVFSKAGTYATGEGRQATAFDRGTLYFRHGAKSVPASTEDIAALIERRVNAQRKTLLSAVKRVVRAPEGAAVSVLPAEVRDSDSPSATPIRVVDDPGAPAYRLVDYDKTHPYRQKELLAAFRERMPGRNINQFDLLVVRHLHPIDSSPELSHKALFGTRQYSQKFLDWLVEQATSDLHFFEAAREIYARRRDANSP
jgi:hypothetical protein